MKKVLILIALAMLAAAPMANASQVNAYVTHNNVQFTVNSYGEMGQTIYYNADAVEQFTYDMLTRMGATNISVQVMNGFGNDMVFMPAVSAQFDSLRASGNGAQSAAQMKPLRLAGDAEGMMAPSVFDGVKGYFDLTNVQENNSELGGYYRYDYQMNILSPAN